MAQGKENYTAEKVLYADLNQISKNANDGGGFRDDIQAHESITALRPVFLDDTENQWKYCDANDVDRLQFDGFALEAGSADTAMAVQLEGIVRGLSSLDVGKKYYVQDDGTIGTTPGTYEILVGVAISATELLILKGNMQYIGSASASASVTTPASARFAILKLTDTIAGNVLQGSGIVAKQGASSLVISLVYGSSSTGRSAQISVSWSGTTISMSGQTSLGGTVYFYK